MIAASRRLKAVQDEVTSASNLSAAENFSIIIIFNAVIDRCLSIDGEGVGASYRKKEMLCRCARAG